MRLPSLLGLVGLAAALPSTTSNKHSVEIRDDITYNVFSHAATNSTMSYVTDSGICETTPNVTTYSGYLSVGANMNMFFWFFSARTNASTAPLALWLNGGPGCSSMIGLFQEHGPCQFYNGSDTPSINPYSWNTFANMLYVDQPIGTGFSYGDDEATSTVTAAPYVWALMQAFYEAFPEYENRNFGLFTESYGGHYGPEFAEYFESQNAAVAQGSVAGDEIKLVALGINNGWFDAAMQYRAYIEYAANNTYRPLINLSEYSSYMAAYESECAPAMALCAGVVGNDSACLNADDTCYYSCEGPIENSTDFDVYDVRQPSDDAYPPETYVTYLQSSEVMSAIGARQTYAECPDDPYYKIVDSGDEARPFLDALSSVVESGIQVLIWAGDADWICNWIGGFEVANAIAYNGTDEFASKAVASYTVDGVAYGEYKTVDNLSWLRVYEAGHEVPYYQPEISLQAFWQTLQGQPLTPT